jgi:hypothetical protein
VEKFFVMPMLLYLNVAVIQSNLDIQLWWFDREEMLEFLEKTH